MFYDVGRNNKVKTCRIGGYVPEISNLIDSRHISDIFFLLFDIEADNPPDRANVSN